jgi:hypothetical protein
MASVAAMMIIAATTESPDLLPEAASSRFSALACRSPITAAVVESAPCHVGRVAMLAARAVRS